MKKAYFSFGFILGILATAVFFALFKPVNSTRGEKATRLKIAHTLPTNHPVHQGIEQFAERLAYHSGGSLALDIYPNGQLGSETQTLEQMQSGTLDIAKVGGATLGNFIPLSKLFSLPYLFRDDAHYWGVLKSEIGEDLLAALSVNGDGSASGFRGLTYYDAGSRNFYTQIPIKTPADLEGLKVRVMNDPVAIDLMKAFGASPTPISWGELYTALQQNVVDGAENNPPSFVTSRHFEVCKHFTFDHHSRIPDVLIISQQTWDRLDEEQRTWIERAASESSEFQREAWAEGVDEALEVMESEGVEVHHVDLTPFIEATESVRSKYATGPMQGFLDRIESFYTP